MPGRGFLLFEKGDWQSQCFGAAVKAPVIGKKDYRFIRPCIPISQCRREMKGVKGFHMQRKRFGRPCFDLRREPEKRKAFHNRFDSIHGLKKSGIIQDILQPVAVNNPFALYLKQFTGNHTVAFKYMIDSRISL